MFYGIIKTEFNRRETVTVMNSYEYIVKQKSEGIWLWRRIGMIGLYTVLTLAFLGTFLALKFPWAITFLPLLVWVLIFFTWRYVSPEYEYATLSGEITFTTIWGGKSRKTLFTANIKDFTAIAPYDAEAEAYVTAQKCNRDFRCMSSLNADDLYYGIFMLGDEKCVVYFEATEKALKILKYYNRNTVVTETRM